jgi:L-histidine Nalpha-methyltransferase
MKVGASTQRIRSHAAALRNLSFWEIEAAVPNPLPEIVEGLQQPQKRISSRFFYDQRGSHLFDRICELPEYYVTRTEVSILRENAEAIGHAIGRGSYIIEPGAGACAKVQPLLRSAGVSGYVPLDISADYLWRAAAAVAEMFPLISVTAIAMDFLQALSQVNDFLPNTARKVLFYPGSSIGNFTPEEVTLLLRRFADIVKTNGVVLLGYDLKKDEQVLYRAYNDSQGLTAEFNLNVLRRFNAEFGADFDLSAFRHSAVYNAAHGRIEMYLESLRPQIVHLGMEQIQFDQGERVCTEYSYKYAIDQFAAIADKCGLSSQQTWVDPSRHFAVALFTVR